MTVFFSKGLIQANEGGERSFYIPIVEQLHESNYDKKHSFSFAQQEKVRRKFYSSPELLQAAESARLSAGKFLSCYKVLLTEEEQEQFEVLGNVCTAVIHFNPAEIESLIVFKHGMQVEHANPFYEREVFAVPTV